MQCLADLLNSADVVKMPVGNQYFFDGPTVIFDDFEQFSGLGSGINQKAVSGLFINVKVAIGGNKTRYRHLFDNHEHSFLKNQMRKQAADYAANIQRRGNFEVFAQTAIDAEQNQQSDAAVDQ